MMETNKDVSQIMKIPKHSWIIPDANYGRGLEIYLVKRKKYKRIKNNVRINLD